MSLPRATYDPRRVFLFDFPKLSLGPKKREIGVYLSGAFVRPPPSPILFSALLYRGLDEAFELDRQRIEIRGSCGKENERADNGLLPSFPSRSPPLSSQFAIGWWVFIDAVILSKTAKLGPDSPYEEVPVHINFADWVSGIIATRQFPPPPSSALLPSLLSSLRLFPSQPSDH